MRDAKRGRARGGEEGILFLPTVPEGELKTRTERLMIALRLGTLQGGVQHQHLDYCLDEFAFRLSRRTSKARGMLFYRLAQQAAAVEPAPYRLIIHRDDAKHEKPLPLELNG